MSNSFKELREKYADVPACELLIANYVYNIIVYNGGIEFTDEEYQSVCEYVYEYVQNSSMGIFELVEYIRDAIFQGLPILDHIMGGNWEDADEIIYARM